jgi:tetratricopeptide (TPR) repeat protein
MSPRERKMSEVLKRGYSDEELSHLYELGRFFLEAGKFPKAQKIFSGIIAIAPDHLPSYLGLTNIAISNQNFDQARQYAEIARRLDPSSPLAAMFLATVMFALKDLTAVGSLLGEIGDALEGDLNADLSLTRFYKMQLARFQGLITT